MVSSTVSNFKKEHDISLETLQLEKASSRDDVVTSCFFVICCRILELCWGTHGAFSVGRGKSNVHSSSKGALGIALVSQQGKLTSSRLVSRNSVFLSNIDRDLGIALNVHPGRRPHFEWQQRTSLSSRVATSISWSPLSGLNKVKPPVEF